jgi:hypothetical protein
VEPQLRFAEGIGIQWFNSASAVPGLGCLDLIDGKPSGAILMAPDYWLISG